MFSALKTFLTIVEEMIHYTIIYTLYPQLKVTWYKLEQSD